MLVTKIVNQILSTMSVSNIDVAFQTPLQPITFQLQSYFIFLPISSTKSIIILIFMVFRNRMRLGQDGRNLSEWIRPWFCGLGSGVMDISITFPINKVMFRQQLNGITSKQAINQLKGDFLPVTQICVTPLYR